MITTETRECSADNSLDMTDEVWCYCKGQDEGEMIFCESDAKGRWYCPECRVTVKKVKDKIDYSLHLHFVHI